jgi:hypothetical protein
VVWNKPVHNNVNPFSVLHTKLSRRAKALWIWAKSLVPQGKITMAICREIIFHLELAQEPVPFPRENPSSCPPSKLEFLD